MLAKIRVERCDKAEACEMRNCQNPLDYTVWPTLENKVGLNPSRKCHCDHLRRPGLPLLNLNYGCSFHDGVLRTVI
uniref:Uncharacterized protein n=1 Tax=Heterorhabditis bacteriophora TaxID=37862 RepID=A0A1I7WQZ0_HETBA